ncbi:MAG: FAD-dependent oxidoreductase [Spirochaetota bacterium]|nr:FAD-dependent oxidoreductase [Spirochaetota bacterium]
MLIPTIFLISLGFVAAVGLSIASKVFYVWEDPKIEEVEDSLLGANCGGCGYAGCAAAAAAVVAGKAGPDICVAGGPDISLRVAEVMGVKVEIKEPEIASSSCRYSIEEADTKYSYYGVNDCRAAMLFAGGAKECPIGCLGLATCVRACPFGALSMGENGLPYVDQNKCRGCGVCVELCPKNIIKLTSTTNRMIGENRYDECTTPCQRTCPTGINIPAYIRQITLGNYREAIRIIKEKNPLPLIVGRICPAPCEFECRRNFVDEPVAINNLKRFVADYEMNNKERVHPYKAPETENRVAIVGGGAQGLTTAYYLACLGHQPTIYEATSKLGGIVRSVIAKTRLPDHIIDWEIDGILSAGVKAKTDMILGNDYTISSLLNDGYDAVVLSSGGLDSRKILRGNIDLEETIPGIYMLLDFLVSSSRGESLSIGKSVYIIGGGNSTLQAASICKKNGADSVTIIYPYTREDLLSREIDIEKAESEGIKFLFSTVVNSLTGEEDRLSQIGLRKSDGTTEKRDVDTIIVATGRLSDLVFVKEKIDEENKSTTNSKGWHTLETFKMFPDNKSDDIFNLSENAMINDNMAVVKAIGRGRKIARATHFYLNEKELTPQENMIKTDMEILDVEGIENVDAITREMMPKSEIGFQYGEITRMYEKTEINIGLTEEMAKKEANRCLDCGLICYKKSQ